MFAPGDFSSERDPLIEVPLEGVSWIGPRYPASLYVEGDCKVMARALSKYGSKVFPGFTRELRRLLTAPAERFELPEAEMYDYGPNPPWWRELSVAAVELGSDIFLPATSVFYTLRRFGDEGTWTRLTNEPRVVRYEVAQAPVAMIGALSPEGGDN